MKHLYPKSIHFLLLVFLFSVAGYAQNGETLWTKTSQSRSANSKQTPRKSTPEKALNYSLDIEGLKAYLKNAPQRQVHSNSDVILSFPLSNGGFEAFQIEEASVLHPDLQASMPNSRSYVGKSIDNPENTIRLSITPQGLHTMIMSPGEGTQYIDPLSYGESDYLVYGKKDLPQLEDHFLCEFETDEIFEKAAGTKGVAVALNDGFIRTLRIALASTVEYSQFHWEAAGLTSGDSEADKKDAVMNAMMVTMTRVNGIYERELSLHFEFVPNNKDIIFIDSDSFNNNNGQTLLGQNQTEIDNTIGDANYDIGHVFSTGGGGVADLGSACLSGFKARGVTGLTSPVGDAYDVDYVSHELGHQLGAPHTFNSEQNQCGDGNRTNSNAYEPGSGSTIMAYAGLCSPENVQSNSDDYFHQKSLQMIWAHIATGSGACATQTTSGNSEPVAVVSAGSYTIPISTPYKLIGASTDADGTASHTYTWEQYDLGNAGLPSESDMSGGPLVRSYQGTTNATRYIPELKDLIYSNGSTTWEKLASVSRDINFKLTVRDNAAYGRTASADVVLTTVSAAGPFVVTSQNTAGIGWVGGESKTITWDVAGTTGNGVNTANVNILLSTDGGLTYPIELATNVSNDGSETITVPDITEANCRVMVEAVGNVFFAINSEDFAIGYTVTQTCNQYTVSPNLSIPDNTAVFVFSELLVTESTVITDINVGVDFTHTSHGDLQVTLFNPDFDNVDLMLPFYCSAGNLKVKFDDDAPEIDCSNMDTYEVYQARNALSAFNGEDASGIWRLGVADVGANDEGFLNSWYIEICTTTTEPLSMTTFEFEDLKVFPNPNKGEFNFKLSTVSSNIEVQVFDMRGRSIYSNNFEGNGNVSNMIQLNNAQSGMYILSVNDGFKQSTRKIIVE